MQFTLVVKVIPYCSNVTFCNLCMVSKQYSTMLSSEQIWKIRFKPYRKLLHYDPIFDTWKDMHIKLYTIIQELKHYTPNIRNIDYLHVLLATEGDIDIAKLCTVELEYMPYGDMRQLVTKVQEHIAYIMQQSDVSYFKALRSLVMTHYDVKLSIQHCTSSYSKKPIVITDYF